MSFMITDSSAKNIYKTMYSYYAGQQMPDNDTGVFFGYSNYTRDKLIYTIEFLKRQYGLGWFTDDYQTRKNAIDRIVTSLYTAFNQTVSKDGIRKFCNWVYSFATHDSDAAKYFSGQSDYSYFDALFKDISGSVGSKVENALETIEYGVKYPAIESITPAKSTLIKWGVIFVVGLFAVNYISKKLF